MNCIIFTILLRNIYLTKSNFISKKYSSYYEEDINYEEVTPENKSKNDNKYYKEEISTLVVN